MSGDLSDEEFDRYFDTVCGKPPLPWESFARELGWESVEQMESHLAFVATLPDCPETGDGWYAKDRCAVAAARLRAVSEKEESNERPLG